MVSVEELNGRRIIKKLRFNKKYRHPDLDQRLTKQRTATEARILCKALSKGLPVPAVFLVVPEKGLLLMELIEDSVSVKQVLSEGSVDDDGIAKAMAIIVATLHSNDIVHGDLTTSNFLYQRSTERIFLIDFGLATQSTTVEDKAVDLYVLERAVKATHSNDHPNFFSSILHHYYSEIGSLTNLQAMAERFEKVRARGRKRE